MTYDSFGALSEEVSVRGLDSNCEYAKNDLLQQQTSISYGTEAQDTRNKLATVRLATTRPSLTQYQRRPCYPDKLELVYRRFAASFLSFLVRVMRAALETRSTKR